MLEIISISIITILLAMIIIMFAISSKNAEKANILAHKQYAQGLKDATDILVASSYTMAEILDTTVPVANTDGQVHCLRHICRDILTGKANSYLKEHKA